MRRDIGVVEPRQAKLQQNRSRETRRKLEETATELWTAQGFDAVSVDEICAAAGVSKGTFYFYSPTKEHLLVELVMASIEPLRDEVQAALTRGEPAEAVLRRVAAQQARAHKGKPKHLLARAVGETITLNLRAGSVRGGEFGPLYAEVFRAAQRAGKVHHAHDPLELGGLAAWVLLEGLVHWAHSSLGPNSLERMLWRRLDLVWLAATLPPSD